MLLDNLIRKYAPDYERVAEEYNMICTGSVKDRSLVGLDVRPCVIDLPQNGGARPVITAEKPRVNADDVRERADTLTRYRQRLQELLKIEHIEQHSDKWYEMRQDMITASNFAQALGEAKFGSQKEFILSRCTETEDKQRLNPWIPPLKWGTMYEPLAIEIYKRRNDVALHSFGLVCHDKIKFFGASPDGITEDGIMLEIKCPFRRALNGKLPLQYYYQIQGQLDTCDLDECEYLECKFGEYMVAGEDAETEDLKTLYEILVPEEINVSVPEEHGLIIEWCQEDMPHYTYSPVFYEEDRDALERWLMERQELLKTLPGAKLHVWRLHQIMVQRVVRNRGFLEEKFPELERVWNKMLAYRQNNQMMHHELDTAKAIAKTERTKIKI